MKVSIASVLVISALARAVPSDHASRISSVSLREKVGTTATDLETRAAGNWQAHAKYYALGGSVGNEILISGTWTDPIKDVGQSSGTCSARIGGISGGTPTVTGCSCQVTGNGPLRFESTCFLDFEEEASDGSWAAGFSVAFKCTAFNSCTGSNAYAIATSNSDCTNVSGTPCEGFKVTP